MRLTLFVRVSEEKVVLVLRWGRCAGNTTWGRLWLIRVRGRAYVVDAPRFAEAPMMSELGIKMKPIKVHIY